MEKELGVELLQYIEHWMSVLYSWVTNRHLSTILEVTASSNQVFRLYYMKACNAYMYLAKLFKLGVRNSD